MEVMIHFSVVYLGVIVVIRSFLTVNKSVLLKQIRKNGCTIITPELEGFRRPNWAQNEADLCVSNVGRYLWGFG